MYILLWKKKKAGVFTQPHGREERVQPEMKREKQTEKPKYGVSTKTYGDPVCLQHEPQQEEERGSIPSSFASQ